MHTNLSEEEATKLALMMAETRSTQCGPNTAAVLAMAIRKRDAEIERMRSAHVALVFDAGATQLALDKLRAGVRAVIALRDQPNGCSLDCVSFGLDKLVSP